MSLRKEVLHRVLLAKSLLSSIVTIGEHPNAHLVARQVLNAHDAADLIFAAIADEQGKLPGKPKSPSMMECLSLLVATDKHEGYFKQLNEARNALKHVGNLPNTSQWITVATDVFDKLSEICQETLDISLDGIDESELLAEKEVKALLATAKQARDSENFKLALEEIGKALFTLLERSRLNGGINEGIEVGRPKAEDALKLTAFGVSANDFLKLQEFLPLVDDYIAEEGLRVEWIQGKFGHPGNWRKETVDFCLVACLNLALSIQNALPTPHAIPFDFLYEYRITTLKDDVELWEDLVDNHLFEDQSGTRPFRTFQRYLPKGESFIVGAGLQNFISEDFHPNRDELIKRVRISPPADLLTGIFYGERTRAMFVDLADVQIICVPKKFTSELPLDLPEIPWKEDQQPI